MNDKILKGILLFSIITIIIGIAIWVILSRRKKNLHKPPSKKNALKQGLGFYSDPVFSRCQNEDGKVDCNRSSTQAIIYNCIPHPVTQQGCVDEDGDISYAPKVSYQKCNLPCVESKFVEQKNFQLKETSSFDENQEKYYSVTGSGCNKIIDKKTGLRNENYFLGNFNKTGTYDLKTCIPSKEFVGYSVTTVQCQATDGIKGDNNCNITCGNYDNSLNYSGVFGTKLSSNVLQHYPFEYLPCLVLLCRVHGLVKG